MKGETGVFEQLVEVSDDYDTTDPPVMDWVETSAIRIKFQSNAVTRGEGFYATVSSGV